MRILLVIVTLVVAPIAIKAQSLKVEYDKNQDLSGYKTFQFGEGEIITPKDLRQVPDATLHEWVREAIAEELSRKGLQKVDSGADLVASYVVGAHSRSDVGSVGPLGLTPGSSDPNYARDYREGSLVVDLNEKRSSKLIWRINSTSDMSNTDSRATIKRTVAQGFKKLSLEPRKQKKKK